MTVQDIMEFSNQITVDTGTIDLLSILLLLIIVSGVGFLLSMVAMLAFGVQSVPNYFLIPLCAVTVLMSLCLVGYGSFYAVNIPRMNEIEKYEAAQKEWTKDYVAPYLLQNQMQTEKGIRKIEYNYKLEEQRKTEEYLLKEYNVPVTIEMNNGKTIEGWAMIGSTGNGEEMVYYAQVEQEMKLGKREDNFFNNHLMFDQNENIANGVEWYKIEKGYYLITVFTDKRL